MSRNEGKRQSRKARETGWLPRSAMAAVFDVSGAGFDKSVRLLIPSCAIRGKGRTLRFHSRTVIEAWARHHYQVVPDGGKDDLEPNTTPTSPYLELYREEKWRMAVLERQEREGAVVSVRFMRGALFLLVSQLRAACERLQQRFGDEAVRIIEEALVVVEEKTLDLFTDVRKRAARKAEADNESED